MMSKEDVFTRKWCNACFGELTKEQPGKKSLFSKGLEGER